MELQRSKFKNGKLNDGNLLTKINIFLVVCQNFHVNIILEVRQNFHINIILMVTISTIAFTLAVAGHLSLNGCCCKNWLWLAVASHYFDMSLHWHHLPVHFHVAAVNFLPGWRSWYKHFRMKPSLDWSLIFSIFIYYVGIILNFSWPTHYVSINTVLNVSKIGNFQDTK